MRIHRLDVTAFGPYPGHETIDMEALGADGLFLLYGDTGAGKTTLLDAIAFALFGTVPGARGEVKRLRSDLADAATPTRVSLELTVQGYRFQVERSPEFQRAKRRGTGTTTQPASASLTWVDGVPSGFAADPITRIDEVSRTTQRLLGMSAEQFFQVVLLPQGEFARFLRADTTEREQLLERLFGTRRFAEMEKWFRERRTERGREVEALRGAVREHAARFAQVAADDQPERPTKDWVSRLSKQASARHEQAAQDEAAARQAREAADARVVERKERAERVRRVASAHDKLAELHEQASEISRAQDELDRARRVTVVRSAQDGADRVRAELDKARSAERRHAQSLDALGSVTADGSAEELRERAGSLREQAGALATLAAEAKQQRTDEQRLSELSATAERDGARAGELAATVRDAVDAHQHARQHLLDLRSRRLSGMAAELAGELEEGSPCAVCGAVEHPSPAEPTSGAPGEQEERAAEDAETRSQQERERLEAAKSEAERAAAQAESERSALAATVTERAERLEAARGEHPDIGAKREHLLALVDGLERLADSRGEVVGGARRLAEQEEIVAEAMREAGFDSLAAALDAARTPETMEDLSQRIAEADKAEAAARAVLAEPELADVGAGEEVDVSQVQEEAEGARDRAESALVELRTAARASEELASIGTELVGRIDQLEPAEQAFAELDALTDVVNGRGQNARKMSLRSYVLAARLEEVAAAGTERLRSMSQGRYSFVHSDAAGARGMRGGLGIDVLDDFSGLVRPAKTLSGGESFLASLSLALGLADVVAAETGGSLLDTLFIDEGFGTLDTETLDLVMGTLDELRAGGRVVGLVSHVEELRQRIPTRLRARKARSGSTLEPEGVG